MSQRWTVVCLFDYLEGSEYGISGFLRISNVDFVGPNKMKTAQGYLAASRHIEVWQIQRCGLEDPIVVVGLRHGIIF